ncbi:MAG: tRNA dihydrouridine synthase DusB [Hyphomicrobium sp.]|uniref:tRNA dihydrouridine synthase DusB n=1 Tax=Hyphomicrobium sp. TaxID=82 RepID=UPI00132A54CF|nr:tRNA dihydrouridine synthase DusB [Hyphomicrobium sp.]KAB2942795.1 MAG: tRNA dihydrouridine synthase DusB [Hyphomicrobium sp.]MBZ0211951.1 tRNA dihydrouridine synthase DusB [Hyphomicrobium sp.]
MTSNADALTIGGYSAPNRVLLAPMSGVTDLPFRRLAQRLGAGLVVSEMVASEELVRQRADVLRRAEGSELTPLVIQLVGREARWMEEGARIVEGLGADIIDINMGCPAREVTGKLSGSALMRDLDLALSLIEAVVRAVRVPVTLKMRLGWDERSRNAAELARRAESAGVKMITVHGRTRCQFFKGRADWSAVREVSNAVSVPVIVNGDIASGQDAADALAASGAAGVMIGRGAYGAPWLPGRIASFLAHGTPPATPSLREQARIAIEHVEAMLVHYGAQLGLRNARKHIGWYLEKSGRAADTVRAWRRQLCTETNPARVLHGLSAFYEHAQEAAA